jgi:hypothetical protein
VVREKEYLSAMAIVSEEQEVECVIKSTEEFRRGVDRREY